MRNSSTIALPPTGRSALVINASTGIEPTFSWIGPDGAMVPAVKQALGPQLGEACEQALLRGEDLGLWCEPAMQELLRTSINISADDHLLMVASLQSVVEESVSKTVNLPPDATIADVEHIYEQAYSLNLKGITIYRDGTSRFQPRKL